LWIDEQALDRREVLPLLGAARGAQAIGRLEEGGASIAARLEEGAVGGARLDVARVLGQATGERRFLGIVEERPA
jgi:hypothetical protein